MSFVDDANFKGSSLRPIFNSSSSMALLASFVVSAVKWKNVSHLSLFKQTTLTCFDKNEY